MSKTIFSAFMFALLCTGNLSVDHLNHNKQDFNMQTLAHYQMFSQNPSPDMQDNVDDDDEQEGLS